MPLTQLFSTSYGIDLSSLGSNIGVSFSGTPTITLTAKYSLDLRVGLSTDQSTPVAFIDPGSKLHAEISATTGSTLHNLSANLGFISASLDNFAQISFSGGLDATATDPNNNGRITVGELTSAGATSLLSLSDNPASSLTGSLTLGFSGLGLSGGGSLASGTLSFSLTGSIFGGQGAAPNVSVNVTTSPSIPDLLDKFKNIGPSDVLGMLNQVLGLLSSLASSSAVNLAIPFTNLTLGKALDYATSFKKQVLDPLFKSGDAFKPDANGDGSVNAADINFSSVQDFLNRLAVGIGLAPGTLTATFDESTGELTFPFSFDTNLGVGTPVVVSSATGVSVVTLYDGSSSAPTQDEIQLIVVNGDGGTFTLSSNGHMLGTYTVGVTPASTIQSALRSAWGGVSDIFVGDELSKHIYVVRFDQSHGNVPEIAADGSGVTNSGSPYSTQYVVAPGPTQSFWLAYPTSTGDLALTNPLGPGSSASSGSRLRPEPATRSQQRPEQHHGDGQPALLRADRTRRHRQPAGRLRRRSDLRLDAEADRRDRRVQPRLRHELRRLRRSEHEGQHHPAGGADGEPRVRHQPEREHEPVDHARRRPARPGRDRRGDAGRRHRDQHPDAGRRRQRRPRGSGSHRPR